jgi:enoyl-CoA hydratase
MKLEYIILEIEKSTAWIRFNRPSKLNAMNAHILKEIESCLVDCEQNENVRVVVLIGNEKAFIAGADIEPLAKSDVNTGYQAAELTMRVQERLADLPKPTIAAISGYALGGGLEMALCCDFRLVAENAVLGLPEIKLGIIPGGGGTQRLPRLVGLGPATEMLMLGNTINAERALAIGLAKEIVPVSQLEVRAEELARQLAEMPLAALRACKMCLRAGLNTGLKEGLRMEQGAFSMLFGTLDQKEGMAAFIEKRKPQFIRK